MILTIMPPLLPLLTGLLIAMGTRVRNIYPLHLKDRRGGIPQPLPSLQKPPQITVHQWH